MKRVAAIYDIHGNLPALEATLADVHAAVVDEIVVGGDIVPGPMPRECMDAFRALDMPVHFIRGNGDREVLAFRHGASSSTVPPAFQEVMRWNAEQLRTEDDDLLGKLPLTLRMSLPAFGEVLFCHATPRNDTDIFTRATPVERLMEIFAETNAALVVCGHTHMQFDRTIGRVRVLNAGSVGMSFGGPGAYWLMLGGEAEFRCTSYDLAAAAERIRATSYPLANDFAERNVLHRPSEGAMLAAYAKAELR